MARQPTPTGLRSTPPTPSDDKLQRHGARLLNPIKAPRFRESPPLGSYVADRLNLPGDQEAQARAKKAIEDANPGITLKRVNCGLFALDRAGQRTYEVDPDRHRGASYRLEPDGSAVVLPDSWQVLENARSEQPEAIAGAFPDRLMFGPSIGGNAPYTSPHDAGGSSRFAGSAALASYGQLGSGGRQVVSWVGAAPQRRDMPVDERPRVAFYDTGCGAHPWLDEVVTKFTVGCDDDRDDLETYIDPNAPLLGELNSHAGHGTFVAGIIRQQCPDAELTSVRVMASDGVVKEWQALHALGVLADQMARWIDGDESVTRVDVVVLSLGYYIQTSIDPYYTSLLKDILSELGSMGVIVVASSGNDATTSELYPAAFSPRQDQVPGDDSTGVPLIAVGSLNPDGDSIALFNNYGDWIRVWEPGVSLVSTVPTTMRGALQPSVKLNDIQPGEQYLRSSIDNDNFASGFALWSGTSFSAPLLAGRIAAQLLRGEAPQRNAVAARRRGWAAVEATTRIHLEPRQSSPHKDQAAGIESTS